MSFADPTWLIALGVLPVAVGLAVAWRRRASRYAIRFTAVSTALVAAGAAAGRRRQLPAVALLAAIAALAIALARPRVSDSVPVRSASIMLVSDESGSMAATDVRPTPTEKLRRRPSPVPSRSKVCAKSFLSAVPQSRTPAGHPASRRRRNRSEKTWSSGACRPPRDRAGRCPGCCRLDAIVVRTTWSSAGRWCSTGTSVGSRCRGSPTSAWR